MDSVGREVNVVREEDDVVVGVRVALVEELLRRETVLNRGWRQVHGGGGSPEKMGSGVQLGF